MVKQQSYQTLRPVLNTGDLVLFSGTSLFSSVIKLGTLCPWSHVGMIIKLPVYDFLTLWESTAVSELHDLERQHRVKGVQLVSLWDRVHSYPGDVAIRQLQGPQISQQQIHSLLELRQALRNKTYERQWLELIGAAYDGPFGDNQKDLASLFCSELVAEALQTMKIINDNLVSNEFTPADFAKEQVPGLLSGYAYGELVGIKTPSDSSLGV